MKNSSLELLNEIVKLWKKYGEDSFKEVSDLLTDSNFQTEVPHLFENLRKTVIKEKASKNNNAFQNTRDAKLLNSIKSMKSTEPEKAELLLRFRDQLINKDVLLTLRDINTFARDERLHISTANSRREAIMLLLNSFINMSMNELNNHLSNLPKSGDDYQRSLGRWSDIISKKNLNK